MRTSKRTHTSTDGKAADGAGFWSRAGQKGSMALVAGGGIMLEPNVPLHVPGHRALVWLMLLIAVRLLNGAGWAAAVGVVSAGGALALGGSPHEAVQYVIAGVLLDAGLVARPTIADTLGPTALLGGAVSLAVSPVAAQSHAVGGPIRLVLFAVIGGVAGLGAWGLVALGVRLRPTKPPARMDLIGAAETTN